MENFQTVYAKNEGAVTAPTSGLHFTLPIMKRMELRGIGQAFITLHCGLGCFRDIDVEDLTKHKTDSEQMIVSQEACDIVNTAKQAGKRVCAVGTSTLRATETAVSPSGMLKTFDAWTNKFIFPPYDFQVCNSLLVNLQMPLSTRLMLVAAFGGYDLVMRAYQEALKGDYKFGTYGDSMLII